MRGVARWAATLLTIAYLKANQLDKVYALVPYLLRPFSLASRSAAFNMAALEAADGIVLGVVRQRDSLLALVDADALLAACQAVPALETA